MCAKLLLSLHFVRHGQTTANRDGVIQGQQDYELTPLGVDQAKVTAAYLKDKKYWQAHTSDLLRASRTAETIVGEHDGLALVKSPLLREFALGVHEDLPRGTSWTEARRIKAAKIGVSVEDYVEPKREASSDVQKRARVFLDALIADARREAYEQRKKGGTEGDTEKLSPGDSDETSPVDSDKISPQEGDGASPKEAVGDDGKEAVGNDGSKDGETGRTALIVSHGGLLHVMMMAVMQLGEKIGFMSNCAVAVVDVFEEKDGGGVVSYVPRTTNDDSHMVAAGLAAGTRVENFGKNI